MRWCMCLQMNIFLYILASKASCAMRHHSFEKKEPPVWVPEPKSSISMITDWLSQLFNIYFWVCVCVCVFSTGLRTACGVLFLVTVTCLLAILSVNSDMIIFHYLFAGFNCVQVQTAAHVQHNRTEHLYLKEYEKRMKGIQCWMIYWWIWAHNSPH